jgi:amidase
VDSEIAFAGIARQADLMRDGDLSSRELVELYLDRIQRLNPELNAFRIVYGEAALLEAEQADARRQAGESRPLLGVPIAVKDNIDQAGEVTPNGTGAYDGPAERDCEQIRRLREAGAVLIGRVLCPELSAIGATESPTWGVTRNPWNTDRTPGGSSGGSAAAVAAGLAAGATASDGAGSIRLPAANCGLFGLKPQRGRVSTSPDPEHWHGMSVYGCLTRTVLDTAVYLDAVAGAVPGDRDSVPPPARRFAESAQTPPEKLRIALSFRPQFPARIDRDSRRLTEETAELLRGLGHEVVEREPAYGDVGNGMIPRYLKGIQEDAERVARPERLSRRTRGLARLGRLIPGKVLAKARRDEARQAARINRVLEDCDVILSPQTARPAVSATEWEGRSGLSTLVRMAMTYPYTAAWNVTGQPAASVPAGLSADGLPLAVQLVGRPADESTLLSLAAQIESERPWADRRPAVS